MEVAMYYGKIWTIDAHGFKIQGWVGPKTLILNQRVPWGYASTSKRYSGILNFTDEFFDKRNYKKKKN